MLSDFVRGSADLPTNLEIKWDKDCGFIQVGVRDLQRHWMEIDIDLTGGASATKPVAESVVTESLWVNFENRASINEAIRALRRARDGAFGRDE